MTEDHKIFLDELRESGITNMFDAGAHVALHFDLTEKEGRAILVEWMGSFEDAE
jgi:hypothetical protein